MSEPIARRCRRDRGLTLVELLIVISIVGMVVTTLASAMVVILRTVPSTELRVDDARSTRGLATWLSHDVASTPPFSPPMSGRGGFSTGGSTCGSAHGSNLVEMTWYEGSASFAVSYRVVAQGDGYGVRRVSCSGGNTTVSNVTAGVGDVGDVTVSLLTGSDGRVEIVRFELMSRSGERILVDTSSRNPSEFFPT